MNLFQSFAPKILLCFMLCIGCVMNAQAGYLYVMNDNPAGAGNQVYGFQVNEVTGALTALSGFPVATGGLGVNSLVCERMTIDKANRRLYVINDGADTVSAYAINPSTGALTALPFSPIALGAGTWNSIAVHPGGSPLVIGDGNTTAPRVLSFQITATTATAAAGSPYTTGSAPALSAVFSHDGNYYYGGGNMGAVFGGFSVNAATGVLTALAGSPFSSTTGNPVSHAMDAAGRLFVVTTTPEIRVFTTSSGIPTPVSGNPFPPAGLTQRRDGLIHPRGFYIVAGNTGNNVGVFQINGSGASTTLAAAPGSPFATGGTTANVLALNQSGLFLYVANRLSRNVTTFAFNTATGQLTSLGVQPSNTIGAAGFLSGMNYLPAAPNRRRADFDGDERTDLSVFRDGVWHLLRSTLGQTSVQWGQSSDAPAPSDFDGDGRADITVWRGAGQGDPTRAYFYILQSSTNALRAEQFGSQGDVPQIVGDWDGDGLADPAVFRPMVTANDPGDPCGGSTAWYFRPSASAGVDYRYLCWGTNGDKPLNGDFDGDGRQDAAVFRPSDGVTYIRHSSTGQLRAELWGLATDRFVPADYDGDGKTDLAIFRPSNNTWFILNSSNNQAVIVTFGQNLDIPVPGDYDGDARDDIAIFRPTDGAWYRINSGNGSSSAQQFGQNGDVPIPSVFFRP
jgi:hypothetical protein